MTSEDINKIYLDILERLSTEGKVKAKRRELYFQTFTLTNLDKNILFFPFAQRNWPWILREASDRVANIKNPGTAYHYSKNWDNRREESGLFSYHYSDRLDLQMQNLLSKKLHSRDKVLSVWDRADLDIDGRQPCTIIMQPIMEDDDKMSLVVYMRNNDMINIFPSDVFIHSTYFKYWAARMGIEYKNMYWISAVAYYQKKRDVLDFPNRLLKQWSQNYDSTSTHKWTKETVDDFVVKEELEKKLYEKDTVEAKSLINEATGKFKTDYMRDWYYLMLIAFFKKNKRKEEAQAIKSIGFTSEFSSIIESIKV